MTGDSGDGETPLRRILWPLALVALLAGVILLNNAAANWHYVVSGAPGALLYAASFDGGAADGFNAEWEQYDGRLSAQIADGALRLSDTGDPNGNPFSTIPLYFSDFDLQVVSRFALGPVGGSLDDGFGVIFRLQKKQSASIDDDEFYLFQISNDGFYRVARRLNGETIDLSAWIDTPIINQGVEVENKLRVLARENEFSFYINDEQVLLCIPDDPEAKSTYYSAFQECRGGSMRPTLIDSGIAYGQIGLVLSSSVDAPEVTAEFDNLLVYAP